MSTAHPPQDGGAGAGTAYQRLQRTEEFQDLRNRFRRFVFPMTAFFLTWYFLYVLAATFASDFMSTRVVGTINVGIIFGLLQFVTTFVITFMYARWANREFDPRAEALGEQMEQMSLGQKGTNQ